jgi:hypothetical protein
VDHDRFWELVEAAGAVAGELAAGAQLRRAYRCRAWTGRLVGNQPPVKQLPHDRFARRHLPEPAAPYSRVAPSGHSTATGTPFWRA